MSKVDNSRKRLISCGIRLIYSENQSISRQKRLIFHQSVDIRIKAVDIQANVVDIRTKTVDIQAKAVDIPANSVEKQTVAAQLQHSFGQNKAIPKEPFYKIQFITSPKPTLPALFPPALSKMGHESWTSCIE